MSAPPLHLAGGPPAQGIASGATARLLALAERSRDLATRAQWLHAGLALVAECASSADPRKRTHGAWLADAMAELADRAALASDELATELESAALASELRTPRTSRRRG